MTVKTLLLVQAEVVVVVAVVALFVWRYWWEPQRQEALLSAGPAAAPAVQAPVPVPPAAAPAVSKPAAPVAVKPTTPKPAAPVAPAVPATPKPANVVRNGDFAKGLDSWSFWKDGRELTNLITVMRHDDKYRTTFVLRIKNPDKKMAGIQQPVSLVSGAVYRLGAKVRSTATINSSIIFGGRVALFLPPQPEQSITWVTENTNWWTRTLEFTNSVTGVGALYVHMGYGNVASTGDFADIRLEKVIGDK
jgi:hypothetical protein